MPSPLKAISKFILLSGIVLFLSHDGIAQPLTQTIYGRVLDQDSEIPLLGVNVILPNANPITGSVTNEHGEFEIKNVPVGEYKITASFIGYKEFRRENIRLVSGQSFFIEIRLEESIAQLNEVTVKAKTRKDEPNNNRALIGARSFTLEETNKYAGSYGDPARMAMNYAGVLPVRDNRNDIIIRGNSAAGLQWRIDGVEIPNPNHFGATGTTGGPITIINTNLLNNSDFFNGAFPAEYGNAIAGVFDLRARPGISQDRQHWFQLGWNGLEFGTEGPFKKGSNATYIVSYRYSVMQLLNNLGINTSQNADYQDLSFKINVPRTKTGYWSMIGMGGKSEIDIKESTLPDSERPFPTYGEDVNNQSSMGLVALSNKVYIKKKSSLQTTLAVTGNQVINKVDSFPSDTKELYLWATENTQEIKYTGSLRYKYKLSAKSNISSGIVYDHFVLDLHDKQLDYGEFVHFTDTSDAKMNLLRAYIDYKRNFSSRLEAYIGLHTQYLQENGSWSLEPRFSMKYMLTEKSSISYGVGLHSQTHPKMNYFTQTKTNSGSYIHTNYHLDFTKSLHNIIGYNLLIDNNHRFKVDLYHQHLYDVPIREPQPVYSLINFGTDYYIERKDSLVNKGKGANYGIEMTFERFVFNKLFYLFTVSLFESNYTSTDQLTRNTAYNGRYAINALGGYEIRMPKKYTSFVIGLNFTYAGGSPYVPFDSDLTYSTGKVQYDWQNAYNEYRENYRRLSLRLGIKRNKKKFSMETAFDFQYRSSYTNIYLEKIDVTTGKIVNTNKMAFYPMANVRVNF